VAGFRVSLPPIHPNCTPPDAGVDTLCETICCRSLVGNGHRSQSLDGARRVLLISKRQFERNPRYRLRTPQEPNPPQVAAERAISDDRHHAFVA